jgi:hypothetical protein
MACSGEGFAVSLPLMEINRDFDQAFDDVRREGGSSISPFCRSWM